MLFGAHLLRFAFSGRTNVVACPSDTHFHVLRNVDREISFRILGPGLSSVQLFKSHDKSVNPVRLLHFLRTPRLRPGNHYIYWVNVVLAPGKRGNRTSEVLLDMDSLPTTREFDPYRLSAGEIANATLVEDAIVFVYRSSNNRNKE